MFGGVATLEDEKVTATLHGAVQDAVLEMVAEGEVWLTTVAALTVVVEQFKFAELFQLASTARIQYV